MLNHAFDSRKERVCTGLQYLRLTIVKYTLLCHKAPTGHPSVYTHTHTLYPPACSLYTLFVILESFARMWNKCRCENLTPRRRWRHDLSLRAPLYLHLCKICLTFLVSFSFYTRPASLTSPCSPLSLALSSLCIYLFSFSFAAVVVIVVIAIWLLSASIDVNLFLFCLA